MSLLNLNLLLPLVAIGTVADCQSILDPTNRLLVKSGIQILQQGKYKIQGLKQLVKLTKLENQFFFDYQLTSQDLAFTFAPILNSSGRISHARFSVSLLLADKQNSKKHLDKQEFEENLYKFNNLEHYTQKTDQDSKDRFFLQKILENRFLKNKSASSLAKNLIQINQERKESLKNLILETQEQVQEQKHNQVLWVFLKEDYKGLFGLIASRLLNEYQKPVVVVGLTDKNLNLKTEQMKLVKKLFSKENLLNFLKKTTSNFESDPC